MNNWHLAEFLHMNRNSRKIIIQSAEISANILGNSSNLFKINKLDVKIFLHFETFERTN